ncbi:hypothetical protein CERZMDRAFT_92153 [Cercospora zeae-maydis SCOH1-5]|uniref:Uncharacterized protein n=1 Tax=Cercospora zeae-maydis SCOH1-5 TaxID=717836 RepID=A0A6A6FVP4_9PEZI|nr:hypothetical protein CERZMDRAFT_92153 [Cercospora zeae-maydis SCOH1-5]
MQDAWTASYNALKNVDSSPQPLLHLSGFSIFIILALTPCCNRTRNGARKTCPSIASARRKAESKIPNATGTWKANITTRERITSEVSSSHGLRRCSHCIRRIMTNARWNRIDEISATLPKEDKTLLSEFKTYGSGIELMVAANVHWAIAVIDAFGSPKHQVRKTGIGNVLICPPYLNKKIVPRRAG